MSAAAALRVPKKAVLLPRERARLKALKNLLPRLEPEPSNVALSAEQKSVLNMVVNERKNVFFTGAAGSGKSLLLREIIRQLREKHEPGAVAVTASTGMAATNIGGTTLHAWGSMSAHTRSSSDLVNFLRRSYPSRARWFKTKVLVIDEVSMIDANLFDIVAKTARMIRDNPYPFGGIQIVCTGDFFQLPPVAAHSETVFAFESNEWKRCMAHTVSLNEVFRQKDPKFVEILNGLRQGIMTPEANEILTSLSRPLPPSPTGIIPTELFPTRREVAAANAAQLAALPIDSPLHTYKAEDSGAAKPEHREKILSKMIVGDTLELKLDAQVMMLKNIDDLLVNGSVGRVVGFYEAREVIGEYDPKNGTKRNISMGEDGKPVLPPRILALKPDEKKPEKLPLVEFPMPGLKAGKEYVLVGREEFRVDNPEGTQQMASRLQIPLILAWAMSVHKAQGQSIERVKIDLTRVFEKGQSYVALSRAASLEGLQVIGYDPEKVQAHPRVVEWTKTLGDASKLPAPAKADQFEEEMFEAYEGVPYSNW